jgi:hypothetical protein
MFLFERLHSLQERTDVGTPEPAKTGKQTLLLVGRVLWSSFAEIAEGGLQRTALIFVQPIAVRLLGDTHQQT